MTMGECLTAITDQATMVNLTESDIPGALLSESMDYHTMQKWWLLC